jgi:hypothetical protein
MVHQNACGTTITRSVMARPFIGWRASMLSRALSRRASMAGMNPTGVHGVKIKCLNREEFVVVGWAAPGRFDGSQQAEFFYSIKKEGTPASFSKTRLRAIERRVS